MMPDGNRLLSPGRSDFADKSSAFPRARCISRIQARVLLDFSARCVSESIRKEPPARERFILNESISSRIAAGHRHFPGSQSWGTRPVGACVCRAAMPAGLNPRRSKAINSPVPISLDATPERAAGSMGHREKNLARADPLLSFAVYAAWRR